MGVLYPSPTMYHLKVCFQFHWDCKHKGTMQDFETILLFFSEIAQENEKNESRYDWLQGRIEEERKFQSKCQSRRSQVVNRKDIVKNFNKFTKEHMWRCLFLSTFLEKWLWQVRLFSYHLFGKFSEHVRLTASKNVMCLYFSAGQVV